MNHNEAVDVATLIMRIEQIDREQTPEHFLWDRVMSCDIVRLKTIIKVKEILHDYGDFPV